MWVMERAIESDAVTNPTRDGESLARSSLAVGKDGAVIPLVVHSPIWQHSQEKQHTNREL
jgi:hypothetical protein